MKYKNYGMNRKGFMLAEFTLKLVIAVLCIGLLVFLIFSLYSSFSDRDKKAQAEGSLDRLVDAASKINTGAAAANVLVTSPNGWYVLFFKNGAPDFCAGKGCLCICSGYSLEKCNSLGACKTTDLNLALFDEVSEKEYISLAGAREKPIEVEVKKDGALVKLSRLE